ncbi:hypothetical protein pipiens_001391 [Culex pipiens pipiens]|uniref:Uncharacterized protein n=1 Tax=Culex pipiens pipiens TaxID=38569 RepID=A0ABD1CXU8_CULPP
MISETDEEPMDLSIPGRPSQNLDIPARRRCLFVSASHPVDLSYRETIGTTSFDRNSSFGVPLPVRPLAANQQRAVSPGTFGSNSCFGAPPQGVSALIASFRPLAASPGSYSSVGAPPKASAL